MVTERQRDRETEIERHNRETKVPMYHVCTMYTERQRH